MNIRATSRADLHCHSTASQVSKLGVQRALGLPECATPPEEVYALAKRRGMDFVTITDHDTIDGVLEIADRPDVFVSEELTAWFRGEPQAVHVLCYGITPDDHEWLQAHADDVEAVAEYLHEHEIACALAHPFYAVEAPLTPRHRRRLAQLFAVWEVRNGSRAPRAQPARRDLRRDARRHRHRRLRRPRRRRHRPHVDRDARAPRRRHEFLAPRARRPRRRAHGEQGCAAKWAHARDGARRPRARPRRGAAPRRPARGPADGRARDDARATPARGAIGGDLGPEDAPRPAARLARRRRPRPERARAARAAAVRRASPTPPWSAARAAATSASSRARSTASLAATTTGGDLGAAAAGLFDACVPAIPYAPAAAFLGREKRKLAARDGEPLRVALVADGIGGMHGVTHTLDEIRERGVPGFEVEVIGTDAERRPPAERGRRGRHPLLRRA